MPRWLRKKAKIRLLTRAAQNRDCMFAGVYRAATVRESVPSGLLPQPPRCYREAEVLSGIDLDLLVTLAQQDSRAQHASHDIRLAGMVEIVPVDPESEELVGPLVIRDFHSDQGAVGLARDASRAGIDPICIASVVDNER